MIEPVLAPQTPSPRLREEEQRIERLNVEFGGRLDPRRKWDPNNANSRRAAVLAMSVYERFRKTTTTSSSTSQASEPLQVGSLVVVQEGEYAGKRER